MRVLLGGVAAALALTVAPQAASARPTCAEGFETVCTVYFLVQNAACHPKLNPC